MSKKSFFYLTILGSGLLICTGFFFSTSHEKSTVNIHKVSLQDTQDLYNADNYLQNAQPEKALALILQHKETIENVSSENHPEVNLWVDLFIRTSEALHDYPQLVVLHEHFPALFDNKEKTSLIVAEQYIQNGKITQFKDLRFAWQNRETMKEEWVMLDADQLLLEGKYSDAIDLLIASTTLNSHQEVRRLLRLSILQTVENPEKATQYLEKALSIDPKNADLRLYRAKLFEKEQKFKEALKEYQLAIEFNPENVFLKDQLAEFYLRQSEYLLALKVWGSNLQGSSSDYFLAKMMFWNKMMTPQKTHQMEIRSSHSFANYLKDLPSDTFWDSKTFDLLPNSNQILFSHQSAFWLRLLEALKNGDELEALTLLDSNVFYPISWNSTLENSLKRILVYRLTGEFSSVNDLPEIESPILSSPFFLELERAAKWNKPLKAEMQSLLHHQEVFTAAFLAAGWVEAALNLSSLSTFPSEFPEWVSYQLTKVLKTNRNDQEALNFALLQSPTPQLSLFTGELLFATGQPKEGIAKLSSLTTQPSEIGQQATLILAKNYFKEKDYPAIKELLSNQSLFADSLIGKEMRARIALQENDKSLASAIYTKIAHLSNEAKSYLARQAFENKNWAVARSLTEELLERYPTNALLKENLEKIKHEQIQAQPS